MVDLPEFPQKESKEFWSTDQTCETCKNPVDIKLDKAGNWTRDPRDSDKLQGYCRSCSKPHPIKMTVAHAVNQYGT